MNTIQSYFLNSPELTIHRIISPPEEGIFVNSYILETAHNLVLFDLPLLDSCAAFIQSFVGKLNKPISRIYISHAHPDHFFGLSRFKDKEAFASEKCIAEIAEFGYTYLEFKRSQMVAPADLPDTIKTPEISAKDHVYTVDGIDLHAKVASNVEYLEGLYIEIPQHKIFLAGDIIYNDVHHYIGQRDESGAPCLPSWISFLKDLNPSDYDFILPGHGEPAGPELITKSIGYLESLLPQLEDSANDTSYRDFLKTNYPNYRVEEIIDISSYFLFNPPLAKS
jgi:glyoxylase-like metal-dependent hydrolase (beta-lactamase superfamily II)